MLESKKDIEWLKKEAYLDIYNDYPEMMDKLSDEWIRLVFLLNAKSEPTCLQVISTGSISASIVHPREVFYMS